MKIELNKETLAINNRFTFYCPGCKVCHEFGTSWQFNGDFEKPTVHPSILVTGGADPLYRCHSFIKDGQIQFFGRL